MRIGTGKRSNNTPNEYLAIAKELCDDLPNNIHYVALRLEEIQKEYHLTMDEVRDLAWWDDTGQVFQEIYFGDSEDIYNHFGYRIRNDEEAPFTSPREYKRRYNKSPY